jgi:uncharacterized YccA/Bax inhibitor family protein
MAFGNPLLRSTVENAPAVRNGGLAASYNGVAYKLGIAFLALLAGFAYTWYSALSGGAVGGLTLLGCVGGLVLALVITFTSWANAFSVSGYALCEGLALGGISAVLEARYPHIVMQSALGTVAAFGAIYALYSAGVLRASPAFMRFLYVAIGAIAIVYLVDFIARMVGHPLPLLNDNGPVGIAISVVIVGIAALSLVADFGAVDAAVEQAAPVEYEWRLAFGLMVSLVWLYVEILRLLSKVRSRD